MAADNWSTGTVLPAHGHRLRVLNCGTVAPPAGSAPTASTRRAERLAPSIQHGRRTWSNVGSDLATGVDNIDFWIGGLAEKQTPFGGLLGSTFNFVFENQLENLQDGDRFYYLAARRA